LANGKKLRVVDLKILIQARGVKPVNGKRHDLIEQWSQVGFDYYEIEVPAWTDEDDCELQKWRTLEIDDVANTAARAVEAANDEAAEAKLHFQIAPRFELGSASELIQNYFRTTTCDTQGQGGYQEARH
jgi:hypothetical protein